MVISDASSSVAILGTFTIKRGGRATQLVSGPYSATIADDGVGLSSIVLSEEEGDTLFFPFREVILTVVRPKDKDSTVSSDASTFSGRSSCRDKPTLKELEVDMELTCVDTQVVVLHHTLRSAGLSSIRPFESMSHVPKIM